MKWYFTNSYFRDRFELTYNASGLFNAENYFSHHSIQAMNEPKYFPIGSEILS